MAGPAPDGFGVPMSRRMPSRDVVPTRRKVLWHSGMQWPQEFMNIFLLPPIGGWNDLPYLAPAIPAPAREKASREKQRPGLRLPGHN